MENGVKEKAYMALYARVREAITGGIYRWGGKLPSKRAMAERYGVSVITVEHAYALLTEEGYVEPRERSGYFIIYKEEDAFPVGYRGKEVNPVLHSETDEEVFPFSVYAKTARTVLSKWGEKVLARSPNQGTAELRNALCDYLARSRNIIVSPQQICIGSGAEYLYSLVVQALGRERLVAVEDPCYEKIRQDRISPSGRQRNSDRRTETGRRTCASCDTVPQLSKRHYGKCFKTAGIYPLGGGTVRADY